MMGVIKMGVANAQKYTISKHAAMRIRTRFNIVPTRVKTWVNRFLTAATFFQTCNESEGGKREVYKKDDVLMVLDVEQFIVVTAYQYNPFDKTSGLSDDMKKLLRPSLKRIIGQQHINLRDKLDGLMLDLQLNYQSFQTHPQSMTDLQKYLATIAEINKQIADSQALIENVHNLIK
jgi:hypothetical protein